MSSVPGSSGEFGPKPRQKPKKPAPDAAMKKSLAAASKPMAPVPPIAPEPPKPPKPPKPAEPPAKKADDPGDVASRWVPAARRQASKTIPYVEDDFDYDVAFGLSFVGVGQGGGRMSNSFYELGYRRTAALNTTEADFDGLPDAMQKHSFDVGGARKDARFAAEQVDGREEEIWELLTRAWGNTFDYGLVCIGLGGGSGSGMGPQVVQIARQYMEDKGLPPRVGAIISLPTMAEGQQVARNAVQAFQALLKMGTSPLIVIDNARIQSVYRPPMAKLYGTANDMVSQYLHLFNRLCEARQAQMTFDRSEFAQILDSGIVVMGAAPVGTVDSIDSPADIAQAIREELTNNVLAEVDLRTGHVGACLFVANDAALNTFDLEYFNAGFSQLRRTLGTKSKEDPVLHRGLYEGSGDGISVYSMIGGLQPPVKRLTALAREAGLNKHDSPSKMASFLGIDDAV